MRDYNYFFKKNYLFINNKKKVPFKFFKAFFPPFSLKNQLFQKSFSFRAKKIAHLKNFLYLCTRFQEVVQGRQNARSAISIEALSVFPTRSRLY